MIGLALGFLTFALGSVDVEEPEIRLRFHGGSTVAVLPVDNQSHQRLPVAVDVELVDPDGKTYATGEKHIDARPGSNVVAVRIAPSLVALDPAEGVRLPLYRVRYRVRPLSEASLVDPAEGIVSVSEVTPELFELRVAHSEVARAGRVLRATAFTSHPLSRAPVDDVAIDARLLLDARSSREVCRAPTTPVSGSLSSRSRLRCWARP